MLKILESSFHFNALFITILTSIIFVTFFIMAHSFDKEVKTKFNFKAVIIISIYEVLLILLLVITVSLFMLSFIELIYFLAYKKYSKVFRKRINSTMREEIRKNEEEHEKILNA